VLRLVRMSGMVTMIVVTGFFWHCFHDDCERIETGLVLAGGCEVPE